MAWKVRTTFIYVVGSVFFCASLYHHYFRHAFASQRITPSPAVLTVAASAANYAIRENLTDAALLPPHDPIATPSPLPPPPPTTSILLPDWEVLVIASPDDPTILPRNSDGYFCLFDTGELSQAKFTGVLPFPDRATFSCVLPLRARRRLPFRQPILTKSPKADESPSDAPPVLRWSFVVYDSLTTDEDVVLFAKGVNVRQGINREPQEFRCVFGDSVIDGVRTTVTSSMQEVFRCKRPNLTAVLGESGRPVKVSLEIVSENLVVPSVAYYTPPRRLESGSGKSLLCATTMVYDVAKFLREWVVYHSRIGVDKFLLYDNGSDDDLAKSVDELVKEGFDISTYFWRWPKTQEAGFSHSVIYSKDACSWMMYLDVDEFIYSPNWHNISQPSNSLLRSLITPNSSKLGQISIGCNEFGPSNQKVHPPMGVTQGYNCRRTHENRHKSIVRLSAVNDSLLNAIHHFYLRPGYKTRKPGIHEMVVNHYKYQAWPEFKAKFRRRVSAYVLDWTQKLNPHSNDRTPGLGYEPVEPQGWPKKFCEVHDNKLKDLVRRWFRVGSGSGSKMAWQR
ncbi:Domain of unknown function (DUF23 [Striga hermonthica]|uniref:Glycosyltransferase family 92 protein n=1 Tax=Striga hermonthica TaxID=68872 RepID=A0A9N7R0Q9_STRHE|nr:Domain of unknown function (DUF23 [Striga hermonthica]